MSSRSNHPESRSAAQLTAHEIRRVAVEAGADPRTVAKYLSGKPIISTCKARIERALEATRRKAREK